MILFCHFANSTSFGPLQTTCWFQPDVGFCDETLPTSTCLCELITQQHHRPWLTIRCTHGWPSKILKFKIDVQNSPCFFKNTVFPNSHVVSHVKNHRVWVLYIDDLLALNYHFRKLRAHDPSSLRIAPRSSGLGYVGWEPKKWERRSITGITCSCMIS